MLFIDVSLTKIIGLSISREVKNQESLYWIPMAQTVKNLSAM